MRGAGLASCAEFADLYRTDPAAAETFYYSWAQGLMSGMNVALNVDGTTTDLTDAGFTDQVQHLS